MPVMLPFETRKRLEISLILRPPGVRDSADITSKRGSVVLNSSRNRLRMRSSISRLVFKRRSHSRSRDFDSASALFRFGLAVISLLPTG